MSEKVCPSCTNMVPQSSAYCPYCYYEFETKSTPKPNSVLGEKKENVQQAVKNEKPERVKNVEVINPGTTAYTPPVRDTAKPNPTVPKKTSGPAPKPQQAVPGKTNGSTPNPQGVNKRKGKKLWKILVLGMIVYAIFYGISSYKEAKREREWQAQIEAEARRAEEEEAKRLAEEEEAKRLAEEAAAQDPYANIEYADQYVFPDSNLRYLTDEEVENLDYATLRIAINELYARHGYVFSSEDMAAYFGSLDWYEPNPEYTDSEAVVTLFNEYETANKLLFVKYRDLLK